MKSAVGQPVEATEAEKTLLLHIFIQVFVESPA